MTNAINYGIILRVYYVEEKEGLPMQHNSSEKKKELSRSLRMKSVVIPIIFALVTVIICTFIFNSDLSFIPDGHHDDALTTTAPTQTTEFDENEFSRNNEN